MEKNCKKCNILKPLSGYYKHKMMLDGHLNFCIDCKKKDAINTRNKRREYYIEYDSKRYYTGEKRREQCLNSSKPSREMKNLRQKQWRKDNKEKYKAHNKVQYALKAGKLKKPKVCYCCDEDKNLNAHHEDYNFPLFVYWVCVDCHRAIHKLEPF